MAKPLISRLLDGTLYRMSDEGSEVFVDGKWVPAKSVTAGDVSVSKPLTEAEIADLVSERILQPTKTSRKSQVRFSTSGQKAPAGSGFRDKKEFLSYLLSGLDKRQ